VQQFLQQAFLDMWEMLAKAVGDLDAVLGFEMMNEPHRGYIDLKSLHEFDYNTDLHLSYVRTYSPSFSTSPILKRLRSFSIPIFPARCRPSDLRVLLVAVVPDAHQQNIRGCS